MAAFFDSFPDVEVLLELAPEEVAANILFHVREVNGRNCHAQNFEVSNSHPEFFQRKDEVNIAVMEAWSWLEAQGLLIHQPGGGGSSGFRVLSRRARNFEDDQDFLKYAKANRLPKEILHDRIRQRVWSAFVRGEYDNAVLQAMKAVEISVREAAGYDRGERGAPMMRRAFHKENGPLTDMSLEEGEREALGHLFAGVYGYFRNPNAHHDVPLDSPEEAMEIVLLANHLLRIVDAAVERNGRAGETA
jgi:uncharacterized protein (TIGR02391 family)